MLFLGSWKMDPNCIDIGPYSLSASYVCYIPKIVSEYLLKLLYLEIICSIKI